MKTKSDSMASDEESSVLSELVGKYEEWEDATLEWREDCSDQDKNKSAVKWMQYYDGEQLTESQKAELRKRGQPPVVKNRIAKRINNLIGTEIDSRTDPVAYPRTPAEEDEANASTDMLRYFCDKAKRGELKTKVAKHVFVAGVAGCVTDIERRGDSIDIVYRFVPWDRCWWDPRSEPEDCTFSDARYKGCVVWLDVDEAKRLYPDSEAIVESAISHGNQGGSNDTHQDKPKSVWFDRRTNRIKITECYYKNKGVWYLAVFNKAGFLLKPMESPWVNDWGDPICGIELCAAVRDSDGLPYGPVKNMVYPQDEINKRSSKALDRFSRKGFFYEEGAFEHPDEARIEAARPDAMIKINPGFWDKIREINNGGDAQGDILLLQEAKIEIDETGPERGSPSSSASGRAWQQWRDTVSIENKLVFDHLNSFDLNVLRQTYHRMRQFCTAEQYARVRDNNDESKGYRFVAMNKVMTRRQRFTELLNNGVKLEPALRMTKVSDPEALLLRVGGQIQMAVQSGAQIPQEQMEQAVISVLVEQPEMGETFILNDVAKIDVDIVLDTSRNTAVVEQEEFEKLVSIAPAFLQAGKPFPLEALIKASHLRGKREFLNALKDNGPDPQQQQLQQQIQVLQMAQAQANVEKTGAEAHRAHAAAAKDEASVQTMPSKADRDQATAMREAAYAGSITVPKKRW